MTSINIVLIVAGVAALAPATLEVKNMISTRVKRKDSR